MADQYQPFDEPSEKDLHTERELARLRGSHRQRFNPELAAFLSLIVPGAGQIYLGQRAFGLGLLVASILLIKFLIPWVLCILVGCPMAYAEARRLNGQRGTF